MSQRIEEAVNTVEGIDELRSISGQGSSFVIVTFNWNATSTPPRRMSAIASPPYSTVPRDIDPPLISKFNNEDSPVLTIALSRNRSLRELTELADKIVKVQLERSAGVGEVRSSAVWSGPSTSGSMRNVWRPTRSRSQPCAMRSCDRMPMCRAAMLPPARASRCYARWGDRRSQSL